MTDTATTFDGTPSRWRTLLRPRLPAVLIHLGISGAIFVVLMALIVFVWYPGPFFAHDGGWRGTLIVVAVDLVLGPTLTLVVFDPHKARWKTVLDLTVIGLIQAAALAWGIHTVEDQRPLAAAWYNGAFHPVTADLVRRQGGDADRIASLHEQHPALVYVQVPADPAGREAVERRWGEGFAPQTQVELLVPLAPNLDALRAEGELFRRLAAADPRFREALDAFFLANPGVDRERAVLAAFYGRYGNAVFVLDPQGRRVGVIDDAFEGIL